MFLEFFYGLRGAGLPVGTQEWLTFMDALQLGLHGSNLFRFYHLARSCLVKNENQFDAFDRVFAGVFKGVEGEFDVTEEVLEWLADAKNLPHLSAEDLAKLERLGSEELMRRFLETLAEQEERHDGGGRWVGTGGRSPFGHSGVHPTGIRVGGPGRSRSAMKVAEQRRFRDYRTDVTLDVRRIRFALKRLRRLTRSGEATELDLNETIDETCRNAGEIEFVFRPPRKNTIRIVLLMDVGGTMDPYFEPVSRLLTVLYEERGLRSLEAFYFHNCVYDYLYRDARMTRSTRLPTADLFRRYDERWKLIVLGDAAMHPAELMEPYGNIDPRRTAEGTGVAWLQKLADHYERAVWINPEPETLWQHAYTNRVIRRVFPMYHLSIDGIADAIGALVGPRRSAA